MPFLEGVVDFGQQLPLPRSEEIFYIIAYEIFMKNFINLAGNIFNLPNKSKNNFYEVKLNGN